MHYKLIYISRMMFALLALLLALALTACGAATPGQTPVAPLATRAATQANATSAPTSIPTSAPTSIPIEVPTAMPTSTPVEVPTSAPTAAQADPCTSVEHLATDSPEAQAIGTAFVRSLPAERDVGLIERLYGVDRLGEWVVLEASFTQAEPGVFVLRQEGTSYREIASWGGPVQQAHELQDYLSAHAPDAPQALLTCLRPKQEHFNH